MQTGDLLDLALQAELQRALAALAFKAGTACAPYAALFDERAWRAAGELFCKDLYRLHSMPPLSQLTVHLQARRQSQIRCCGGLHMMQLLMDHYLLHCMQSERVLRRSCQQWARPLAVPDAEVYLETADQGVDL